MCAFAALFPLPRKSGKREQENYKTKQFERYVRNCHCCCKLGMRLNSFGCFSWLSDGERRRVRDSDLLGSRCSCLLRRRPCSCCYRGRNLC